MPAPILRIGPHALPGRALLAPLSGVTDLAFRRIAARRGAALVVSEMVASEELARGSAEARLRAEGSGIGLHVVQLAGREPAWTAEAARLAVGAGAAIIDLNMGCPAKKVVGGLSGAALMREPDRAARLIEAALGAGVPVTVKMRLGWELGARDAPALARRAEALGAAMITVHGRTRAQFYEGAADWGAVGEVVDAVRVPVVVNGDVVGPDSAARALEASGAAGAMVGRAAVGRPWLVGAVAARLDGREPVVEGALARADALEHYEGLIRLYGRAQGVRHARKHVAAYADEAARQGAPEAAALRARLVTAACPDEVLRLLERALAGLPARLSLPDDAAPAASGARRFAA